jgi:hypothetical protein
MSDKLNILTSNIIRFVAGERPTADKFNAMNQYFSRSIENICRAIGDMYDRSGESPLSPSWNPHEALDGKSLDIVTLARLIGPASNLNPKMVDGNSVIEQKFIGSDLNLNKQIVLDYIPAIGLIGLSDPYTIVAEFTPDNTNTLKRIEGHNNRVYVFNPDKAFENNEEIVVTYAASSEDVEGGINYIKAGFNVIPDPNENGDDQKIRIEAIAGDSPWDYKLDIFNLEIKAQQSGNINLRESNIEANKNDYNQGLEYKLPAWWEDKFSPDVGAFTELPEGLVYLKNLVTKEIYLTATYGYADRQTLYIKNATLCVEDKHCLILVGTDITTSIDDLRNKFFNHRHDGSFGEPFISVKDIVGIYTSGNFGPSSIPDNPFSMYLHRKGYQTDSNVQNGNNAMLGDIFMGNVDFDGISNTNISGGTSHKILFGDDYASLHKIESTLNIQNNNILNPDLGIINIVCSFLLETFSEYSKFNTEEWATFEQKNLASYSSENTTINSGTDTKINSTNNTEIDSGNKTIIKRDNATFGGDFNRDSLIKEYKIEVLPVDPTSITKKEQALLDKNTNISTGNKVVRKISKDQSDIKKKSFTKIIFRPSINPNRVVPSVRSTHLKGGQSVGTRRADFQLFATDVPELIKIENNEIVYFSRIPKINDTTDNYPSLFTETNAVAIPRYNMKSRKYIVPFIEENFIFKYEKKRRPSIKKHKVWKRNTENAGELITPAQMSILNASQEVTIGANSYDLDDTVDVRFLEDELFERENIVNSENYKVKHKEEEYGIWVGDNGPIDEEDTGELHGWNEIRSFADTADYQLDEDDNYKDTAVEFFFGAGAWNLPDWGWSGQLDTDLTAEKIVFRGYRNGDVYDKAMNQLLNETANFGDLYRSYSNPGAIVLHPNFKPTVSATVDYGGGVVTSGFKFDPLILRLFDGQQPGEHFGDNWGVDQDYFGASGGSWEGEDIHIVEVLRERIAVKLIYDPNGGFEESSINPNGWMSHDFSNEDLKISWLVGRGVDDTQRSGPPQTNKFSDHDFDVHISVEDGMAGAVGNEVELFLWINPRRAFVANAEGTIGGPATNWDSTKYRLVVYLSFFDETRNSFVPTYIRKTARNINDSAANTEYTFALHDNDFEEYAYRRGMPHDSDNNDMWTHRRQAILTDVPRYDLEKNITGIGDTDSRVKNISLSGGIVNLKRMKRNFMNHDPSRTYRNYPEWLAATTETGINTNRACCVGSSRQYIQLNRNIDFDLENDNQSVSKKEFYITTDAGGKKDGAFFFSEEWYESSADKVWQMLNMYEKPNFLLKYPIESSANTTFNIIFNGHDYNAECYSEYRNANIIATGSQRSPRNTADAKTTNELVMIGGEINLSKYIMFDYAINQWAKNQNMQLSQAEIVHKASQAEIANTLNTCKSIFSLQGSSNTNNDSELEEGLYGDNTGVYNAIHFGNMFATNDGDITTSAFLCFSRQHEVFFDIKMKIEEEYNSFLDHLTIRVECAYIHRYSKQGNKLRKGFNQYTRLDENGYWKYMQEPWESGSPYWIDLNRYDMDEPT